MAGIAAAEERRIRARGVLDESVVHLLTSAISDGDVVLELSEVTDADEAVVSLLARLPAGQCGFVGCPSWLARRIERRRVEFANQGR